ncbi:MAG: GNAT family N-acetyltransferase [Bacilli bacterium]|nr:GNAT family N-acetyltransferase [Bacilli bacterium]
MVRLELLSPEDREQFIKDNQEAFKYGACGEVGEIDDDFNGDEEIISRETITRCIDHGIAYRIVEDGIKVGGLIQRIDESSNKNELEILFINPKYHNKGLGQMAWKEVERLYPKTKIWITCTPYFEKRNIHFYVNKLGFKIVKFYNSHYPDPNEDEKSEEGPSEMFLFEKTANQ